MKATEHYGWKDRVEAESVRDFIIRWYKHDRLFGRDDWFPGYAYGEGIIAYHEAEAAEQGYTAISRHESKTGEVVYYYTRDEVGPVTAKEMA